MQWPKHFPEGCPGPSTPSVDGEVFRLLKKSKLTAKDMESHAEICDGCEHCAPVPPCHRAGLSVRLSMEDAIAFAKTAPRFRYAARAMLKPEHGKTVQSGLDKSHYTLWLTAEALAAAIELFSEIRSVTS